MSTGSRPHAIGPKPVPLVGKGPTGTTTAAGLVKEIPEVAVEPVSAAIDPVKGKVLLQGSAVKSVVSHEVNNIGRLDFKGKSSDTNSNTKDHVVKALKRRPSDALADVTVTGDAKKSIVTVKLTTEGICFDDSDD